MPTRKWILWFVPGAVGLAIVTLLGACGTQASSPGLVDARQSIYPARSGRTLIPQDFAVGAGSSMRARGEHFGISDADLATYVKPDGQGSSVQAQTPAAPPRTPVRPEPTPALPPFRAVVARTAEPLARTEAPYTVQAEPRAANPDAPRYAQREKNSPALAEYRGGDVIVISVTTAVIILLIVLIVVLLT